MKYSVLVNGAASDSVKYETDIARYSATLPLGNRYILSLRLPNFTAKADTIDVSSAKFYTEKQVDFYATSVPWVEVAGVALDNSTFTPIIGASSPKLIIKRYCYRQCKNRSRFGRVQGTFTFRAKVHHRYCFKGL